jgi:tetratricopeptide (TPR) repeat protein
MLNLLYMFTYNLFGPEAWGFHLVNVLFHAANSVLVFLVAERLLNQSEEGAGTPPRHDLISTLRDVPSGFRDSLFTIHYSRLFPFVAALLFATHPVHTEAVTWIAGVSDLSLAFFYLLSFYLYVRSDDVCSGSHVLSVLTYFIAVLCKEPGLTLPVIFIAYDLVRKREVTRDFIFFLKRYLPYFIVTIFYFVARFFVLGGFAPMKRLTGLSTWQYLINVFPVFVKYLYTLFLPTGLNFWPVYDPVKSPLSAEAMLSFFVVVIFAAGVVTALKKKSVTFLFLLLIILPLAPALYLKGIIGKPLSERYLYLPSVGFVMLLASVLTMTYPDRSRIRKGLALAFALVIGLYCFGTISRNTVWKDEYSLFSDTVRKSPDSVVPRFELGNALLMKGLPDEAIVHYLAAMRMEPKLYVIHHHLGLALAAKGLLYDAIEQYRIATTLNPESPEIHEDLGRALAGAGFRDLAIRELEAAVVLRPSASLHNFLGVVYAQVGQMEKAVRNFRRAGDLEPAREDYRRNLAAAVGLEKSLRKKGDQGTDHLWEYEERSLTKTEMFSFVW